MCSINIYSTFVWLKFLILVSICCLFIISIFIVKKEKVECQWHLYRPITHIDCFAGPGGICTGLTAAGFRTLVAIEFVKSCCDTYQANHPEVHCIYSDIRDVVKENFVKDLPEEWVDLITSGMPCETFSMAGTTSRSFYDDR